MIAFGIALLICHCSAATITTTMSSQAAIVKFRQIIDKEVENLWHNADTNHDGKFTASDMNVIFVDYDHDNDSSITKDEFVGRFTHNEPGLNTVARGLFLEFDVNRDSTITHNDLDQYYQRIDADNNGNVNHAEFKAYFTKVLTLLFVLEIQNQNAATTTAASG